MWFLPVSWQVYFFLLYNIHQCHGTDVKVCLKKNYEQSFSFYDDDLETAIQTFPMIPMVKTWHTRKISLTTKLTVHCFRGIFLVKKCMNICDATRPPSPPPPNSIRSLLGYGSLQKFYFAQAQIQAHLCISGRVCNCWRWSEKNRCLYPIYITSIKFWPIKTLGMTDSCKARPKSSPTCHRTGTWAHRTAAWGDNSKPYCCQTQRSLSLGQHHRPPCWSLGGHPNCAAHLGWQWSAACCPLQESANTWLTPRHQAWQCDPARPPANSGEQSTSKVWFEKQKRRGGGGGWGEPSFNVFPQTNMETICEFNLAKLFETEDPDYT